MSEASVGSPGPGMTSARDTKGVEVTTRLTARRLVNTFRIIAGEVVAITALGLWTRYVGIGICRTGLRCFLMKPQAFMR